MLGETDNIYLNDAIRSLVPQFPELAEIEPDGKITLRVRLYKYPKSSTARILGLHDGGNMALNFAHNDLHARHEQVQGSRSEKPGHRPIRQRFWSAKNSQCRRAGGEHPTEGNRAPTFYVVRNLMYAMPTPLP